MVTSIFLTLYIVFFNFYHNRSKDFRSEYGQLHELRALVPHGTPYVASTATATRSIKEEVISNLKMFACTTLMTSPDRANIYYEVLSQSEVGQLKKMRNKAPRAVVYCRRTLNSCADLYAYFHFEIGNKSYFPDGAPKISDNCLFGMFHSSTPSITRMLF